ncbi:hypothetical protein [Kitasatospora sp. NPDC092286]|uniref:hypothetical protein n=1 Tax=Kitasatospora sp. NPDC092286 TaxID=3364087 RepID=UPI00382325A0
MSSRIRAGHRGLAAVAGLVFTVGLALTGCDPAAGDGATAASSSPAAVAAAGPTTPAPTTPAPVATAAAPVPAPPVVTTPAAVPTTEAPQPTQPPAPVPAPTTAKPQAPATKAPQPKITTAQPPTDPEPEAAKGATGSCEIRSNAGNCYQAGQFCRNADLDKSTHDANGRMITCRMVSGKPHWQA